MRRTGAGLAAVNRYPLVAAARSPLLRRRGRRSPLLLNALSEQAQLVHAGRPHFIDNRDNIAVLGPGVAANEDGLIWPVREAVADNRGDLVLGRLGSAQEDVAAARNGDDDCVLLIGVGHVDRSEEHTSELQSL